MIKFDIINNNRCKRCDIVLAGKNDGISIYELVCEFEEVTLPKEITVSFDIEFGGAFSIWNYSCVQDRRLLSDWRENLQKTDSRLARGIPIHSVIGQNGENVFTVSVSDIKNPLQILSGVNEKRVRHSCFVRFFTQKTAKLHSYRALIRIDERKIDFYDAISSAADYLREINGTEQLYIPNGAKNPVFSTWYNFHQDINEQNLSEQFSAAYELGMRTIIIDDGWQTDDDNGGYAFCGDWKVCTAKFPDMKRFVDKAHKAGFKVMMWYSVPFIGKHSDAAKRFKGMFLDDPNRDWCCLDPRFPKVRDFLISKYETAAREWGTDGFKLDFIDEFKLTKYSDYKSPERDYDSLDDAVEELLREISKRLKRINPDVLIEFRQNYIGPVVTAYANMLRAGDCAMDAITNRISVLDLRMTSGKVPVHSDMVIWDYADDAHIAAKQLCAVMFAVPQVSVRLDKLPKEHRKMLKNYLTFFNVHSDVLLGGRLTLYNPECGYSMAEAENNNKKITVCYVKNVVSLFKGEHYIVNGTGNTDIFVKSEYELLIRYTVTDCTGRIIGEGERNVKGVSEFNVPESGILTIRQ